MTNLIKDNLMFLKFKKLSITIATLFICSVPLTASELIIYSARKSHLIDHVFKTYEKKSGVKIKYLTDKAGPLLQKIISDGEKTPADIYLTVDAGNLWAASEKHVFEKVDSKVLQENIPAFYRDPDNMWFGLSVRARTIVYNTKRLKASDLKSYEDLASSKWKNRLVLRTSKKVYNQSLIAMMIEEHGERKTEGIVRGWVRNLAVDVFPNDTSALESIAAGVGDVTIVNTYYYGRLMKKKPKLPLKIYWPNQKSNGVHVNISGAGVLKYSKNKKEAIKLLEWLSGKEAQNLFADVNQEYPVNPKVTASKEVQKWGTFKPNKSNLSIAGQKQADSIKLMDRASYK
jgi:iron(III) transport system substrate-binding protein